RIKNILFKFSDVISSIKLKEVKYYLEVLLLNDYKSSRDKQIMKEKREELMKLLENIDNDELTKSVHSLVFRPMKEMYIPIPNSKTFHENNPHFFGENIGTFKDGTNKLKLPKEKRIFKLEFLSSGDIIDAYINQDGGKSIQSYSDQQILGEWILYGVFQLKPREILTEKKLNDIGINGIRLVKFKDKSRGIGLEFIWIEQDNPPKDAIGWIAK
ncbi:MAG: hypothetical protein E7D13_08515, partial [Finegoldia magna]|nr:hypothetical protein [Finegoldia magna]